MRPSSGFLPPNRERLARSADTSTTMGANTREKVEISRKQNLDHARRSRTAP